MWLLKEYEFSMELSEETSCLPPPGSCPLASIAEGVVSSLGRLRASDLGR